MKTEIKFKDLSKRLRTLIWVLIAGIVIEGYYLFRLYGIIDEIIGVMEHTTEVLDLIIEVLEILV